MDRTLTLVVHGESGVGKSYLADSAPSPKVVFDVEGGVRFTPSRKIFWDPRDEPPKPSDEWDTAVVTVTDLETIQRGFQWLAVGQHPFRSVVLDSLTEVQKRAIDAISGADAMKLQDYGTLLRKIEAMVRAFRDLTLNQLDPVEVVVFVCGSAEKGKEHPVVRPALVGRMAESLGYYVDVMGFMTVAVGADGVLERRMLFAQVDGIAAKDRTGKLGVMMERPSIPDMITMVYGPEEA